ncbi:MAR-binding filament-like protein 1 [Triticum aestivum]|uniref:MAR-binding filament-like protein 1 n=1 Tax=Triticum aestivum TaxID=4565 RepID=UPI001D00514B|nr:MAR-binding filament-like protein 1 [Triticum aestivum]
MGYHHLLVVSPPAQPPPSRRRLSLLSRSPRGAVTAAASPDAARSSSVVASSAATRRRAVLLVGISVLPLLRLRDAATSAAQPSAVDLVTDKMDIQMSEEMQPEETRAGPPQPEVKRPSPGNPLASLLNAIAVIASGLLAGLLGTTQREKKALQSVISSMEIKLAEDEAAMSLLRENYEKRLLDEQVAQKKQARMFQDEEASLLDQLASTKRTVKNLNEEVMKEKELVEQLKHEIHDLEISIAQAEEDKHAFEENLRDKLETLDILHGKVNLLSQDVNDKEENITELSSSLSTKEGDYQSLHLMFNQTKESLEHANSRMEQLEKYVYAVKNDIKSKISSIDSLNEDVQTLYRAKSDAEEKISELMKQYTELEAASKMRASRDSELLSNKDGQLNQLEERLSTALSDSSEDRIIIAELNSELEANRTMLLNEVETRKKLSDLVQSTEDALKESRNELFKLSEELNEVNISNHDLTTQISEFTNESNEVKQALIKKVEEAESVCKALSDELASVKEIHQKTQEDLEVTSNQLVSIKEVHDELSKELLDAYKKLESTTDELVRERRINATLNRELEALVKQSQVESEARRALQADLDEATVSLNEVNESTLFLSNKLDSTVSRISAIKEEKEVLSAALLEQKKSTAEAQKNMVDAQHLIKRLGMERENSEIRSTKLEEELATAKGEMLYLRRQITASGSQNTDVLEASPTPNFNQSPEDRVPNTSSTDAVPPRSAKKIYRRRKDRPST